MGGHHKKNLRAEKAKVKLKGAKLPKGLNVTKTDFKVRKITIREQLKAVDVGDGNARLLNLKETLSRLKHHGSNFRLEALRNLRDGVSNGHPGIVGQLHEIIQGVAAGCLDVEREPRRESFKTLASILGALPVATVAPFFHVISSYLRCAMTHIQPQLQDDSLLMLDVLLQHVPILVAQHSGKIFQHFLEMISRVRAEGASGGRMLNVNMGQKQTSIRWRSKVLQRLQHMLQTLVEHSNRNSTKSNNSTQRSTFNFNHKEPKFYALKRTWYSENTCDLSSIFCTSMGNTTTAYANESGDSLQDNGQILRNYVEHLLPLLIDAWLEVRPHEEAHSKSQIVLSAEAGTTLQVVFDIIENLWTLVRIHESEMHSQVLSDWIRREYSETFANTFIHTAIFPYQQLEQKSTERKDKHKEQPGDTLCIMQNLSVVYLMTEFFANQLIQQHETKFSILIDYLNQALHNLRSKLTSGHFRLLEKSLRAYLIVNATVLLQIYGEKMRLLLRSTITALINNRFNKADGGGISARVLLLLCEIVQTPSLLKSYGIEEFKDFLEFLPELLLRPTISESSLIAMSSLCKQRNECFLRALSKQSIRVLENLQQIQVLGAFNAFEGKKHILNLFFWIDRTWLNSVDNLISILQKHVTDKRIIAYGHFILTNTLLVST